MKRLFGAVGVSRKAELNSRYFYESFDDTDELIGAVYDEVAAELATCVNVATTLPTNDDRALLRSGIRAVLDFSSADPRRGRILHRGARQLCPGSRRAAARDQLPELVLTEHTQRPESNSSREVTAAM